MKIAVDIDEVLCPFLESFIPFAHKELGTNYKLEDFETYNLEQVIDRPVLEIINAVRAFYRDKLENLPSFADALPTLRLIGEEHELIVLTSRHHEAIEKTPDWINKHFPDVFREIVFSSNPAIDSKKTKAMICKELQVDVLIEDDPRHIEVCIQEKVRVIMPQKLWNKTVDTNSVIAVKNWEEIENKLKEIKP